MFTSLSSHHPFPAVQLGPEGLTHETTDRLTEVRFIRFDTLGTMAEDHWVRSGYNYHMFSSSSALIKHRSLLGAQNSFPVSGSVTSQFYSDPWKRSL